MRPLYEIQRQHEARKRIVEETASQEELGDELAQLEKEKNRLIEESARKAKEIQLRRVTMIRKLRISKSDVYLDDIRVPAKPVRIEVEGRDVRVEPSLKGIALIDSNVRVEGDVEFEYENNVLKTARSGKQIRFLPSQVKEKVRGELTEIRIVDEEAPKYVARAEEKGKLLGLIPVTVKKDVEISAEDGEIVSERKPWWNFAVAEEEIAEAEEHNWEAWGKAASTAAREEARLWLEAAYIDVCKCTVFGQTATGTPGVLASSYSFSGKIRRALKDAGADRQGPSIEISWEDTQCFTPHLVTPDSHF